ncbi:MAG: SAM-dependent methyltransferase [Enhygromyxa sp.]
MTIDTSKAHLGRIYDFILGGHHNFEVDRQAAARILEIAPIYPKWARANRWFLQFVASTWAQAGRKRVLDLASGLPTKGHFNEEMPAARILFTDNDPVSVAYGDEMLAEQPNMEYRLADVGEPQTIIRHANEFFDGERELAVSCVGVAYLVPDAVVTELLQALHEWCAPGSVLAVTFVAWLEGADRSRAEAAMKPFQRLANASAYIRTTDEFIGLTSPWRLTEVRSLLDWLEVPDLFSREELEEFGVGMYGAFFER